jgi:hypothetical protein
MDNAAMKKCVLLLCAILPLSAHAQQSASCSRGNSGWELVLSREELEKVLSDRRGPDLVLKEASAIVKTPAVAEYAG